MIVLDPVLGDDGQLYVPNELVPIYREKLLPLADVITPNAFELATLSERSLDSKEMTLEAIQFLQDKHHIPLIVLTSIQFPSENTHLYLIASFKKNVFFIRFEKKECAFTGSGDLFAALFLGNLPKKDVSQWTLNDMMNCTERALNSMQGVLQVTMEIAKQERISDLPLAACRELKLIQSRRFIEHPTLLYKATLMNTV
jgi:pyridoxine kinase